DNHGYGCISRLQQGCGSAPFNNLLAEPGSEVPPPAIDFAKHAESLGATSERVRTLDELEAALVRSREAPLTYVVVIETDASISTQEGGTWWEVAVPEVSKRAEVNEARARYDEKLKARDEI